MPIFDLEAQSPLSNCFFNLADVSPASAMLQVEPKLLLAMGTARSAVDRPLLSNIRNTSGLSPAICCSFDSALKWRQPSKHQAPRSYATSYCAPYSLIRIFEVCENIIQNPRTKQLNNRNAIAQCGPKWRLSHYSKALYVRPSIWRTSGTDTSIQSMRAH